MLLPHPRLRIRLLATGLSVMALATTGASAVESMQTVPGAGGAITDTKTLLKHQPVPVPFEKTETEVPEKPVAKAPEAGKSVIPEPAAAALGLIGLGLILFRRYRV